MKRINKNKKKFKWIFTFILITVFGIVFILNGKETIISDIRRSNEKKALSGDTLSQIENETSGENTPHNSYIVATGLKEERLNASHNTIYLQELIDKISNDGGGTIKIPKGTYYFDDLGGKDAGKNYTARETFAIKCKNNVAIEGESEEQTILKPITTDSWGTQEGIEMFYWNEIRDTENAIYLDNADFRNFTVDGEETIRTRSNGSAGKAFMFGLYKNCDWENVTVKNTDGTGFGMDHPINCTIKNCTAINCGKSAKRDSNHEGCSGFGIGTGYSEDESIIIENCKSIGNMKFGFFFENQSRWSDRSIYTAEKSKGFVVRNCEASNNMYNFGGLRANDVTFENCISGNVQKGRKDGNIINETEDGWIENNEKSEIYFGNNSRRIYITNIQLRELFSDVTNTNDYYYIPIKWAKEKGIASGITGGNFDVNGILSRKNAIVLLWRMAEYPGNTVRGKNYAISTGFSDIDGVENYRTGEISGAIKWATENNIANGTSNTEFEPDSSCTMGQFVTFLYRYVEPSETTNTCRFTNISTTSTYYNAIKWADSIGLFKDIISDTATELNVTEEIKRKDAVTMLYRINQLNKTYNITYNLNGGVASNKTVYNAGTDSFTLTNPTKEGNLFAGWTGTDINVPTSTVNITLLDRGNKVYTANWEPIYKVTFYGNGGNVEFSEITRNSATTIGNFPTSNREGYSLKGWYSHPTDENELNSRYTTSNKVYSNLNLYSQWTVTNYTITYNLDGGSLEEGKINPESYTIESNKIILNNPTKEGYTFIGWTGSNGETAQKEVSIAKGSTGNKSYVANWEKVIENDTNTQTDEEKETGSNTQTDKDKETGSNTQVDKEKETDTNTQTDKDKEKETDTNTQTDKKTEKKTENNSEINTERKTNVSNKTNMEELSPESNNVNLANMTLPKTGINKYGILIIIIALAIISIVSYKKFMDYKDC